MLGVDHGRTPRTDAAWEGAAVILQDVRTETISVAIEEGRVRSRQHPKIILLSSQLQPWPRSWSFLGGEHSGLPPPLLPIQVLWLNNVDRYIFPPWRSLRNQPSKTSCGAPPRDPRRDIMSAAFTRAALFYGILIAAPVFLRHVVKYTSAAVRTREQ